MKWFPSMTLCVVLLGLAAPSWSQAPDQKDWRDEMVDDFLTLSHEVEGSSDQDKSLEFEGNPPDTTSALQAVRESPFLDRECRKEAVAFAVDTMQEVKGMELDDAVDMARKHLAERQALIRDGKVSYVSYLRHIGECKAFCGPLVAELLRCHEAAVAGHERGLVFFALNKHDVTSDQRGMVAEIVRSLKEDPRKKVLLIGRASRIGDLKYNRVLSGKRVLAVKDELRYQGIDEARIETMWLGYEPPQISLDTAVRYGIEDRYRRLGDARMNQSVMMVLYERGEEHTHP